jgi:hypothetical protein
LQVEGVTHASQMTLSAIGPGRGAGSDGSEIGEGGNLIANLAAFENPLNLLPYSM